MEIPIGDFSILKKYNPRRCLPRNCGRHRKYGANSLGFASECLGDGLPWAAAPFKKPEPNSEAPNKQKQARWGEAAQFGFCRQAGGRGNAGVRFSGGAGASPDVPA
jgi:hypothetical protein